MHQLNYSTIPIPYRPVNSFLRRDGFSFTSYFFSTKPNTNVLHLQVLCQRTYYYYSNNKSQNQVKTSLKSRRHPDSRINIIHLHENVKLFFIFLQRYPKNLPNSLAVPSAGTTEYAGFCVENQLTLVKIIYFRSNVNTFFIFLF